MTTRLRLINRTSDAGRPSIVIIQRNKGTLYETGAIAWHVVHNLKHGASYSFTYPPQWGLRAIDAYGRATPIVVAENGQCFHMTRTPEGENLRLADQPASSLHDVQVFNGLPQGAIRVNLLKASKLIATRLLVLPGQRTAFALEPRIALGVATQQQEGTFVSAQTASRIDTAFDLTNIESADIIVTGREKADEPRAYAFNLENVVLARTPKTSIGYNDVPKGPG